MEASASQSEYVGPEQVSNVYSMPEQHSLRAAKAHLAVAEQFEGIDAQMLYACRADDAEVLAQIFNDVNERDGEEKSVGIFTGDALFARAQAEVAGFKIQQPFIALSVGVTEAGQLPDMEEYHARVAQEIEESMPRDNPPKVIENREKPRSIGTKVLHRLGIKS